MSPSKLLEVNLISAQDLPPVSKMLRTFAVAYVTADHKLTTKIDHKGHANPRWNYKMLFHVDRNFLKEESSALTIEIYNLAWLRDLPIGTARLQLNTLSPPLTQNNGYRKMSLQICRPSGHLQGTVSLTIQLVDMDDDISLSSLRISDEESVAEERKEEKQEVFEEMPRPEETPGPEEKPDPEIKSAEQSVCSTPETKYTWQPESEADTRTITSGESVFSCMRPLPSEVAADLKKGFYKDAAEYGSSIFENWTEGGDRSEDLGRKTEISDEWEIRTKTESDEWETEKSVPVMSELMIDHRRKLPETELVIDHRRKLPEKELVIDHRRKIPEKKIGPPLMSELPIDHRRKPPPEKKTGLLKCLSNIHAFELTFVCGSNQFKLRKKLRNINRIHHRAHSDGTLGKFYH